MSFFKFKKESRNTNVKKHETSNEVVIMIGLLQYNPNELRLKPVRGKRISLKVKKNDGYINILIAATDKWKDYCPEAYDEEKQYTLCYENGQESILMPGDGEPFNLNKYKLATGKDFKRLVLYLCLQEDVEFSENISQNLSHTEDDFVVPSSKRSCPSSSVIVTQSNV